MNVGVIDWAAKFVADGLKREAAQKAFDEGKKS
jgi:hypothetical protein